MYAQNRDYALKSMEILNAMFSGAYKQFCEQLSRDPFFERHRVFRKAYQRRMLDLNSCVILVTTLLSGYYNRNERNKEYLERCNEEFPQTDSIRLALDRVFDFIERCDFDEKSRAWKQTDLFTLLAELHTAIVIDKLSLDPAVVGPRLSAFYTQAHELYRERKLPAESKVSENSRSVFSYLKAATKATSDKYARVERARIISEIPRQPSGGGDPRQPARPTRRSRRS